MMNICKYLIFLLIFIITQETTLAQVGIETTKTTENPFSDLNQLYDKGNMHDSIYLNKIDSLAASELDNAHFYSVDEMVENLRGFEKIVWSNKKYSSYRVDYYTMLLNNVYLSNKWGASIFYAEKISKQSEMEGSPRVLIEAVVKTVVYDALEQNDKVIETFEENKGLYNDILKNVIEDPNKYYWDGINLCRLLSIAINAYSHKKDIANTEKTSQFADTLFSSLLLSDWDTKDAELYMKAVAYYKAIGFEKYQDALVALNEMEAWMNENDSVNEESINNLYDWKASLFLDMKQIDSASYYIDKLQQRNKYKQIQLVNTNEYKSKLEFLKGNFAEAYEISMEALKESNKVKNEIAQEMDNLLYAYTEAEHNRLAYEKSEAEKQNRTKWIIVITLLSLTVIIGGYILLRQKDKKLRKTIKELDNTADIQIALMEQFEQKVRKEEQQRISQNLHDDLAGTLVAVKNNIDLQISEITDSDKKQKIEQLSEMIQKAFHNVRGKSHELFESAQLPDEKMFAQHITHLAQTAFPESQYQLKLHIDDYSLTNTSIEFRSELIRVVQEAFTNIIKHAKATQVDVLIYKEDEELFVVIKDNGKGLKAQTKENTLGMISMKNRLEKFNATFSVYDHKNGVTVYIAIPESMIN